MTEDKSKRNRLEDSGANDYIHQESEGFGLLETNNKESSGRSNVKMANPVKTIPTPEPARTVADRGNTPEPKPVEIDDRGQDLRVPPNPTPREHSTYDFYVASVWLRIERDAGLHVPYKEKLRILNAMTGAEEPPAQLSGIIEQLKGRHYSRNSLNDPPKTQEEVREKRWQKLDFWETILHSQGENCEANVKYIDKEGHMEGIYDHLGQLVDDPANMGTYNFYNPRTDPTGHVIYDVIPYLFWGNTPDDPSTISHRFGLSFKAIPIRNDQIEKDLNDSLCISSSAPSYDDVNSFTDPEQYLPTSDNIHPNLEGR